ncbi:hypothetical protein [Aquimarina brevivitae]|uniref:Uncharacterized protein n=1 Tax=Aquimarina brevivitae TaxID=323412 RepID=A0A4Q7PHG3_9FLAO|nr:hypothetical protein [Aquimarina brevivitae]RZS99230.1 hypothetical protein EV197_0439 [Aquimarina brevivitae]
MKDSCLIFFVFIFSNVFAQNENLSDEFNTSNLDATWSLFQEEYFETPVPVTSGRMQMVLDDALCNETCVWWQDSSAGFIYKTLTGDFDVATAVYAKQRTNPNEDVDRWTQLAGLMARDPASTTTGSENYVFNVAGIRFDTPSVELKSTTDNSSTIRAYTDNRNCCRSTDSAYGSYF